MCTLASCCQTPLCCPAGSLAIGHFETDPPVCSAAVAEREAALRAARLTYTGEQVGAKWAACGGDECAHRQRQDLCVALLTDRFNACCPAVASQISASCVATSPAAPLLTLWLPKTAFFLDTFITVKMKNILAGHG